MLFSFQDIVVQGPLRGGGKPDFVFILNDAHFTTVNLVSIAGHFNIIFSTSEDKQLRLQILGCSYFDL